MSNIFFGGTTAFFRFVCFLRQLRTIYILSFSPPPPPPPLFILFYFLLSTTELDDRWPVTGDGRAAAGLQRPGGNAGRLCGDSRLSRPVARSAFRPPGGCLTCRRCSCLGLSVIRSVQCCFTSRETTRLIRDGYLDFHSRLEHAPQLSSPPRS